MGIESKFNSKMLWTLTDLFPNFPFFLKNGTNFIRIHHFHDAMPVLNWVGKEFIINHDKEIPFRLLKTNKSKSVGTSNNLIIEVNPELWNPNKNDIIPSQKILYVFLFSAKKPYGGLMFSDFNNM